MPYVALAHAGRIHYAERGERRPGRPSAVLIHGAGASSAIWMMVLARVARAGHAVAIDLPGHGPSTDGATLDGGQGLTLARYRDAVGELAATLCLGPSLLVGHSLGALVAIDAAHAWPDKVRGLVLCAAAPRQGVNPDLARILRDEPHGAIAWLAENALSPRAKPAVRRGFVAAGEATPADVTRADFEIVAAADLTARLDAVACPVTWLDGADDRLVSPPAGRKGELVTLPDVGHLIPIEAPAAVADAVTAALAK
ncbi:MAG TPA: alpha/beta hydrolase [Polyangia bacterium]|jgi:pimeloyl-ACP methyl ester carboxylesterase|nr:alpha/beta hydrolase [Polyangia bacterium]